MSKESLEALGITVGIVALAWAIALLFHIPFEIISLIGCAGFALFTIFTSF